MMALSSLVLICYLLHFKLPFYDILFLGHVCGGGFFGGGRGGGGVWTPIFLAEIKFEQALILLDCNSWGTTWIYNEG